MAANAAAAGIEESTGAETWASAGASAITSAGVTFGTAVELLEAGSKDMESSGSFELALLYVVQYASGTRRPQKTLEKALLSTCLDLGK